jgi:tRNA uridine 5-carbamoylmethylation protein Kti12
MIIVSISIAQHGTKGEKTMKVINFISGPGAGKSTLCSSLFSYMKKTHNHDNVEYVHEYAKELTWDERYNCLKDQLSILGHQNNMMHRLRGKVDWVVTDTCLVLGLFYAPDNYFKNFEPLLMDVFNSYDNINIFVDRPSTYSEIGRNQTHEEAIEVDKKTIALLDRLEVPYIRVSCNIAPEDLLMVIENNREFSSQ